MSNDYKIAEFAPLEDLADLPDDINNLPPWLQHEMGWLAMEGEALLAIEKCGWRDTSA